MKLPSSNVSKAHFIAETYADLRLEPNADFHEACRVLGAKPGDDMQPALDALNAELLEKIDVLASSGRLGPGWRRLDALPPFDRDDLEHLERALHQLSSTAEQMAAGAVPTVTTGVDLTRLYGLRNRLEKWLTESRPR